MNISLPTSAETYAREQQYFSQYLEGFLKEFGHLMDERDRREFEQQTYFLIQRAQTLAQQPVLDRLTAILSTQPFPPLVFSVPK